MSIINKVILSLPKVLLEKYILDHFSELSVDDFFEVVEKVEIPNFIFLRNQNLNQSSEVLNYMLDINPKIFTNFSPSALNKESIEKIANSKIDILPLDFDKYPMLLENNEIIEHSIKLFPEIIKKVDNKKITKNMISILEKVYYTPDEEDINKSNLYYESSRLMERAILNQPELILKIKKPSDKLIYYAINKGFIPKKEDFINNPYLKTKEILLTKAFENDPSIIAFFNRDISYDELISVNNRGYIVSENDLKSNSFLSKNPFIMEDAIKINPGLIKYLNCDNISYNVLKEAVENYKITKEDIEKHPELSKNELLMELLPELNLYSQFLTDKDKITAISNNLKISKVLNTDNLPFLDSKFGGKIKINKINEFINCFNLSINENDIDLQENYFKILDKIIDGIINIRYNQNKFSFKYPDIAYLNHSLINVFSKYNYNLIKNYINEIYNFTYQNISLEEIK